MQRRSRAAGQPEEVARAKAALRDRVRAAREGLDEAVRVHEQDAVRTRLRELLGRPSDARDVVLLHAAVGSELDLLPRPTERHASVGWRLALPRVAGDDLDVVGWHPGEALAPGFRGVLEPAGPAMSDTTLSERLAVVVVPGVAYDRAGGRLGQGGGHYDRLLARLDRAGATPLVVAPAFSVQVVDAVPRLPHDRLVDRLVLPTGVQHTRIAPG